MYQSIITEVDKGLGILTLNRAEKLNVIDKTMLAEISAGLRELERSSEVRAIVLSSTGKSFCAGIDPVWTHEMMGKSPEDILRDNKDLARLLAELAGMGKPSIARVQGSATGFGVGLIAACDIAFSTYDASFALDEARHGLIAAIASPYLLAAIGERHCRYFMLSAERFSGIDAYRIGLVHEMLPDENKLDEAIGETVESLRKNGPAAMRAVKALLRVISGQPIDKVTIEETARSATNTQTSEEGHQGLLALAEKRQPKWVNNNT